MNVFDRMQGSMLSGGMKMPRKIPYGNPGIVL
jgi:hypothetical protein